jgi:hypothetical protein
VLVLKQISILILAQADAVSKRSLTGRRSSHRKFLVEAFDNSSLASNSYLCNVQAGHLHLNSTASMKRQVRKSPLKGMLIAKLIFWVVAAFYSYGSLVHVLNMLSLTGFSWIEAPLKWRVLDIAYLILDVVVVVGLIRGSQIGFTAFFVTALSQIFLYTVFRDWVLDVPTEFKPTAEAVAYLNSLVIFHIITCLAMTFALFFRAKHADRK